MGPAPIWLIALDNVFHTLRLDRTRFGRRICDRVDYGITGGGA